MDKWIGKVAVVTGASAGIGAAIAVELSKHGINVVGLARRKERIEQLAKSNQGQPGKIYAVECDLMNSDSITKAFEWVESNLGAVDILINNAGTLRNAQLLDLERPDSDYTLTIETNLTGLLLCTRRAMKSMRNQPAGYIININSVAGHITASSTLIQFGMNVYGATKHAVTNLTDTLRLELALADNRNIRVSSLSPGGVITEIFEAAGYAVPNSEPGSAGAERAKVTPMLEASDIADAVVYLLSTKPTVHVSELIIHPTGEQI